MSNAASNSNETAEATERIASRRELEAELRRIGGLADEEIDLAESALALAALERPRVGRRRYRQHLALLASDAADAARSLATQSSLDARATALNRAIVENHGYEGDTPTYDDLQNANLMRVIDRRKGLPVTLGILYLHAARQLGWEMAALNFPGHFLVRLDLDGERLILDPFNKGRVCDTRDLRELLKLTLGQDAELAPDHYATVGNRDILLRLQNNIKVRLFRANDAERAIAVIETMLMFAPGNAPLWCDMGTVQAQLGNLRAAMVALEQFLELADDDPRRSEASTLLQRLHHRLN